MEFKKNRQNAILESLSVLKPPGMVSRPGLFSEAKEVKALQRDFRNAAKRITALRGRLKNVFTKPTTHDPVYKVVQRIFNKQGELNLTRQNTLNGPIRRRAYRRFILGFPPRKAGDTSLGDAVNWEWMVHCATEAKSELVIVSRDSDYGVAFESKSFLNDWLLQEFRDRVSKKRKILLFTRLSEALRLFKVEVSDAEQREEEELATLSGARLRGLKKTLQDITNKLYFIGNNVFCLAENYGRYFSHFN